MNINVSVVPPPPPPTPEVTITLDVTVKELLAIFAMVGSVGGPPEGTIRTVTNPMYERIHELLTQYNGGDTYFYPGGGIETNLTVRKGVGLETLNKEAERFTELILSPF